MLQKDVSVMGIEPFLLTVFTKSNLVGLTVQKREISCYLCLSLWCSAQQRGERLVSQLGNFVVTDIDVLVIQLIRRLLGTISMEIYLERILIEVFK